jgi:hypothetical protein
MRVIKRNIEKVWGARYTLGARCLYIIRDAEMFGVRVISRQIWYNLGDVDVNRRVILK